MNAFRITAAPSTCPGEWLVFELFEAQSDADKLFAELLADNTILADAGYSCYTVSYEKLGDEGWKLAKRKLVSMAGE